MPDYRCDYDDYTTCAVQNMGEKQRECSRFAKRETSDDDYEESVAKDYELYCKYLGKRGDCYN